LPKTRCVVIGATGHIGSWLVPRLVAGGHDVVAVSRGEREPYHPDDAWHHVQRLQSNREAPGFEEGIADLDADVVIDLICFDLASAKRLVDVLRERVGLFLHCGTLWVHGVPDLVPYDETVVRRPFGEYGIRKAEIERYLIDEAAHGFPAAVLHPGHITGPGWRPINPAGNLNIGVFERLARGDAVLLPDDGSARLQHVHADDVAQAFQCAIDRPASAIGEAFHIAACQPVTMIEYARAVADWFDATPNLHFLPLAEWERQADPEDARITRDHVLHSPWASIDKASNLLAFQPRFTALSAVWDAVQRLDSLVVGE
jgi:nucleoside-diphosphate-sugar epimerase